MAWIIVNGILALIMFAVILGVMIAGMRWQRSSESSELRRQSSPHRRQEVAPVVASDRELEAELQALMERSALARR